MPIIPTNRLPGWTGNVGVPGGVPSRDTIFATIPPGASLSTVQSAINSCPSGETVLLSPGNYAFADVLQMNVSGVTLRGSGIGQTTITFSGGGYLYIGNSEWFNDWETPNATRHVNWTGGIAQGSTSITVASAGDLAVGMLLFMDQLNDGNVDYVGASIGPVGGLYSSVANPGIGNDRWQMQLNRVTGISGTTVTLSEPVYFPDFDSGQTPQVWWYGAQPIAGTGAEDLSIVGAGGDAQGVYIQNAYGCWVKGIEVSSARYRVNFLAACRCECRDSYLHGPQDTSDDYVIQTIASSGLLIENNISIEGAWIFQSLSGSVVAYNYLSKTTGQSGWMQGGLVTHGANPMMNLFEGNFAPGLWLQNTWGSSQYNTALRNRFLGQDVDSTFSLTDDLQAINISYWNRGASVVGNVLGTTGFNGWYDDGAASYTCHSASGRVYSIGISGGGCSTGYDDTTRTTLVRNVNWDSANGDIADLNGFQVSDVPNSLYLGSKPSWFGSLTWPPVDPSSPSSDRAIIPAGVRYEEILSQTAVPSASPAGGTYDNTQSVTLSDSDDGAEIYYTLDGSDPAIP